MDKLIADFSRAATSYEEHSHIQRAAADNLLSRLEYFKLKPKNILDLGSGAGYLTNKLKTHYPAAVVTGVDIAPNMCKLAAQKYENITFLCRDIYDMSFGPESVDLLVSNFTLQWCTDLPEIFARLLKIARPDAVFIFSTIGIGSLTELEQSWGKAGQSQRVMDFYDMHDIGDMLLNAGWSQPVMDVERFVNYYPDIGNIFSEFKSLGVTNKHKNRPRGLTGKGLFANFKSNYEALRTDKGLPLSWEVVYGFCRKLP